MGKYTRNSKKNNYMIKNKKKSMRGKLSKRIRKAYNKSFIIFNVMFVGVIR